MIKRWQIGLIAGSGVWYWYFTPVPEPIAFPLGKLAAKRENENELLLQWLKTNGGNVDNITIGVDNRGRRGVFAVRDISAGETVFSVPQKCIIDETKLNQSPSVRTFICDEGKFHPKFDPDKWDHCTSALALFILEEQHKGKDSFFHPYIETLPKKQQLDAILDDYGIPDDNSSISTHLQNLKVRCHEVYDFLSECTVLSKEDWLWAYGNVETRSFQNIGMFDLFLDSFKYYTGGEFNPWNIASYPLGDMVNHSDEPNVRYVRENFSMIADRDIEENEEIGWNYHPSFRTEEVKHYYNLFRR